MNASSLMYQCHPRLNETLRKLLFLFFAIAAGVSAQTVGKISGEIKDKATGEPLIGCNVTIVGTRMGSIVSIDGSYFILNIPPGKYDVQASMLGYQKVLQRDVIVNSGKTSTVNFSLGSTLVEQNVVEVIALRPDVEAEKTSTSAIIRSDDVQSMAGMRDIQDVIGLAADVTDGHFRGGRDGEELYMLQGMGIVNPLDATSAFVPIMSAVEEVEVITSGFGAQYGNAQSGVVNISMKEGKADKWRTKIEARMRAPERKHFGPSVYDPASNPYLTKLLDENFWRTLNPNNPGMSYTASMGISSGAFASDTNIQIQVARTLYLLQTKRDLNRNYGNEIDYSLEGGTGGPIDESTRMFMALRSNVIHPMFPTEQPDVQRQIMGNVTTDFGGATLQLSGGLAQNYTNVFPSSNNLGYYSWLWDRILAIQYQKTTNNQFGARFSKVLSQETFYEIKLSGLQTQLNLGSSPYRNSVPDSLLYSNSDLTSGGVVLTKTVSLPDYFRYLYGQDDFRNEKTLTLSFEASMTSQVTKNHLVNGGAQFNYYTIEADNKYNTSSTLQIRKYSANPWEAGLYVQDKMEFEGMIANVGLRLDIWNANKNAYIDQFNPFFVRKDTSGIDIMDPNSSPTSKTPILGRLQPRAGISFPITVNTVFHLNYGSFMQRPSFQYLVAQTISPKTKTPVLLGNPRLEPQTTNSYDIGVMQGLGEGFTLDVSGYYKDVKNLIQQIELNDPAAQDYQTFINQTYADIRGFRVALSKRKGSFTGSLNYQFGYATGKSATAGSSIPVITRKNGVITTDYTYVPVRDIILDFDRTHNLVMTLGYFIEEGPEMLGVYPFENMTISSNSFARSGRPYTSSTSRTVNGARTPAEYNTNSKITKKIKNFFGVEATFYAEVFNLFNNKILNYSYIFHMATATSPNEVGNYEKYGIDDRDKGIRYWNLNTRVVGGVFAVDQSFLIYDNSPRSFNFGVAVEF